MSETEIGLFAFPWDLLDEGVDEVAHFAESELGVTGLNVPALYHSGKFLLPRNPRRRVYYPEPGVVYFHPSPELYEGLKIKPLPSRWAQGEDPLARIGEACHRYGLRLNVWMVCFHNTGIGLRHPDCCQQNAYGDIYYHALCPSNPHAQAFISAAIKDMIAQHNPYSIKLETPHFLGFQHGFHHEFTPVPHGDLELFLLSLCFCPYCRQRAANAGLDVTGLTAWTREVLDRRLNEDWRSPDWLHKNSEELFSWILQKEELMAFIGVRQSVVTNYVRELSDLCHKERVQLLGVASTFAKPSYRAWMEGTDLIAFSRILDSVIILAYHPTPAQVFDDLRHALSAIAPGRNITLGLNLGLPSTPSKENLMAKLAIARDLGIASFDFYNYGFLNKPRMGWLAGATRFLKG